MKLSRYQRNLFKAELLPDVRTLVYRAKKKYPHNIAMVEPKGPKEERRISYVEFCDNMEAMGTAMLAHGMGGGHIAIMAENSIAWVQGYLAIVGGVGVAVPMDSALTEEFVRAQMRICDGTQVICSVKYLDMFRRIRQEEGLIKDIIVTNPKENEDYSDTYTMQGLIDEGKALLQAGDRSFLDITIDRDALSEIVFTSGTTGANKGVMLCNRNIMDVVYNSMLHIYVRPETRSFSVLPMNHCYEKNTHILPSFYCGVTVCINDSLKHVVNNLLRFRPGNSIMVPLFLDTFAHRIRLETAKAGLTNQTMWGIRFSNILRKFGVDMRRKFFKPILDKLGGNLYQIVVGGAPLNPETEFLLNSVGINILNGYGITECAPLVSSIRTNGPRRKYSCGTVVPTMDVRIWEPDKSGNGEVQVKGDSVMLGYYKDPESTAKTFTDDGWLRTGDLGHLDKDNYLFITGRLKNLIILPNGKNVSPEEIEELMWNAIPYISEAIVDADTANTGIYALCVLDKQYLEEQHIEDPQKKLREDVTKLNQKLPSYKRITDAFVKETEFEKTTSRKIKRFTAKDELNAAVKAASKLTQEKAG